MRWRGALIVTVALSVFETGGALATSDPIWADLAHSHALWVSEEDLNASLDPDTLEPRSRVQGFSDAAESAELKLHLEHFRDFRLGGWVSQSDVEAQVCPSRPSEGMGAPLHDEPMRAFAELILARNEGFVAVGEVESVESGWSPKYALVTSLVTLRDVRSLWSSSSVENVPVSLRLLMSGGWLTVAGIRICREPERDLGMPRIGDRYLVWGNVDPANKGFVISRHALRVEGGRIDTFCASCVPENGLTLEQFEQQLQVKKST